MYLAFNAPHDPRQSPQSYLDRYPTERIQVPQTSWRLILIMHPSVVLPVSAMRISPDARTEHAIRVHRREYYALITHMDAQIGRILDAIETSGQADRTWVFFTADHGLAVGIMA